MGILKRISLIIRSNLNALIEKAEEPERMLDQIIADMIENMREVKLQIARSVKNEKLLERKEEENRKLFTEYEKKALFALEKNDEDLAKEALRRKKSCGEVAGSLAHELAEQKKAVELMKASYKALEAKIDEARQKRHVLLSRQKRAETRLDLSESLDTASQQADLFDAFERMAEKIAGTEDMAGAVADLETGSVDEKFALMERDKAVDEELKELRAKLQKK